MNAGNVRIASRLVSQAESNDKRLLPTLKKLFLRGQDIPVIGITGPPGSGKSTLTNQLVKIFREEEQRIAVLAVDPSSPFSGGAILGDRIRMNQHASDTGVFIRSMSARGQLGGLAKATGDALSILQAMDFDKIILETVGVGQNEIDVIRHATTVLVLQSPYDGDVVQSIKAGMLEIGDVYVVNKADMLGSTKLASSLAAMLCVEADDQVWHPTVHCIEANKGIGIRKIVSDIENHHLLTINDSARKETRLRHRIFEICQQFVNESVFSENNLSQDQLIEIVERRSDPYTLAQQLVSQNDK